MKFLLVIQFGRISSEGTNMKLAFDLVVCVGSHHVSQKNMMTLSYQMD